MRIVVSKIAAYFLTLLLAGLLGASLVRLAPGFGVDDSAMDVHLSAESRQALRAEHADEGDLFSFYLHYLGQLARGNLGESHTLQRPVLDLLRERLPLTARTVALGLLLGWASGFGLATLNTRFRNTALRVFSTAITGTAISIPVAVLTLLFVLWGVDGRYVLGLVIFPKVFRFSTNLLTASLDSAHVVAARAKGLGATRILGAHVIAPVLPQLLALFAVTVSVALSAAIPVEAIADSPGIGQLAWQAAMARDLPVLVNLTLIVTAVTLLANGVADVIHPNGARWAE